MKTLSWCTRYVVDINSAHKHWKEISQWNERRKGALHVPVVRSDSPNRSLITFDAETVAFPPLYRLHLWRIDEQQHRHHEWSTHSLESCNDPTGEMLDRGTSWREGCSGYVHAFIAPPIECMSMCLGYPRHSLRVTLPRQAEMWGARVQLKSVDMASY